ncbi:GGDEF domain-containing protein [Paenibacillus sp. TRM 82003]|nr:GGDEF domain-containing protein [Paenibacillus sp. TRM 82003]
MFQDETVARILDRDWNMLVTEEGHITEATSRAAMALGYQMTELLGLPYSQLLLQRMTNNFKEELRQALRTGGWYGELKIRKKNGSVYWAEGAMHPVGDPSQEKYLIWFQDINRQKRLEQQVVQSECYDPLTGLPNRAFFLYRLSIEVDKARRNSKWRLLLLLFDVDRFKVINDSLGHAFGDRLLLALVERMKKQTDEKTLLARIGGDSFAALFKTDEAMGTFIPRVRAMLGTADELVAIDQQELTVTYSAGASYFPEDTKTAENLMKHAELAMAEAKEQGRNLLLFFDERMNASAMRRLLLPNYLRRAVERQEFEVYFQPKQRLSDHQVYGMEALLRWHSPDLGWVPPDEFIPVAEELGLIGVIGEWVLRTACDQVARWREEGYDELTVSVNVSSKQFQHRELKSLVANVLRTTGLSPKRLELELTESSVMLHPKGSSQTLKGLKKLGVSVSIDDFGTGFSSLNYLSLFPLDTLKIDKTFVQAMADGAKNAALVQAIVDLGHKLGLSIVAEGVETPEQRSTLAGFGCDAIQGYLLSPPIPAAQFEALYLRKRAGAEPIA